MKRKITLILLIIIFSYDFIFSQAKLNLLETKNGNYIQLNDLEIYYDSISIKFNKNNQNIFSETIRGRKNILTSNNEKYFSIINYAFPSSQEILNDYEYKINYFTFDENGKLISDGELNAIYDLPHPIFTLNDNGIIAAFNPYDFKLIVQKENDKSEFELKKDIEEEMERSAFIQIDENNIYVAVTLAPVLIEKKINNVLLFNFSLNTNNVISQEIELSTITMLKLINNKLILSGISFDNLTSQLQTFLMDKDFNVLINNSSNTFEKIIEFNNRWFASFGYNLFELDKNLNVINKNTLPDKSKILELNKTNKNIIALVLLNNNYELININENLAYKKIPVEIKISLKERPQVKIIRNKLFMFNSKNTYIFE